MFKHEKQLFHPAAGCPNPQYAALLQKQPGGGNPGSNTFAGSNVTPP